MNNFYLSKKMVKWSAYLNIANFCSWSFLIFIIFIYHFFILLGKDNSANYGALKNGQKESNGSSANAPESYSWTFIQSKGYAEFFKATLLNLSFFQIPFWYIILPLFLVSVLSFIIKFFFCIFSIFTFINAKNIFLVYASLAAMLLPLFGGIIALNIYNATNNNISPQFVAPYSYLRRKFMIFWSNFTNNSNSKNKNYKPLNAQ